jgi:chromosomal replication initiation ATPase DnaA
MTTPAQILAAVHQVTGCDPADIVSQCRRHSVLFPRYIALLMLRDSRPFFSDIELGRLIGIEGHGTARYALRRARDMLDQGGYFQQAHNASKALLTKP